MDHDKIHTELHMCLHTCRYTYIYIYILYIHVTMCIFVNTCNTHCVTCASFTRQKKPSGVTSFGLTSGLCVVPTKYEQLVLVGGSLDLSAFSVV